MSNAEISMLVEMLGQERNDPKVQALISAVSMDPQMIDTVQNLLRSKVFRLGGNPDDPGSFPIVTHLPEGEVRLGSVDNGRSAGPIFYIREGTSTDLSHIGIFGETRYGKSWILRRIAQHTMINGGICWILDPEDEFSALIPDVPASNRPIAITDSDLRICFFQPPTPEVELKSWVNTNALLLRSETYIRDGTQNLFTDCLLKLLYNKGAFSGSNSYPSLYEVFCYFKNIRLSGSETRGKNWLESLVNRFSMLCNNYTHTSRVTSSNMLQLLAQRSVIFRFHRLRGIPLQFLTNYLMTWLANYKEGK